MKIAFLNIYQGQAERGLETYVDELSKRLKPQHEVDVFSADRLPPVSRWPYLWRIYLDPNSFAILIFTLKLIPVLWQRKYDIVVALNGGWQPALIRILTWFYGAKMVISGQSGIGWDDRNNLWSFPNIFVTLSSEGKNWADKANPFVKTTVIPNGVDTKKFADANYGQDLKLQKPIIISVGALEDNKRHDLAIKAVAKLEKGSLLIVGRGSQKEKLEKLGQDLLGKDRFLIKQVQHSDIPGVYGSAELFTFPTVAWESFGIVMIEAMASGLAVVANDDPIRKEIIGDAGILVDPTDTEKYARALTTAINTNWGDKPRKQAEKFDWDEISEKYLELFSKLK